MRGLAKPLTRIVSLAHGCEQTLRVLPQRPLADIHLRSRFRPSVRTKCSGFACVCQHTSRNRGVWVNIGPVYIRVSLLLEQKHWFGAVVALVLQLRPTSRLSLVAHPRSTLLSVVSKLLCDTKRQCLTPRTHTETVWTFKYKLVRAIEHRHFLWGATLPGKGGSIFFLARQLSHTHTHCLVNSSHHGYHWGARAPHA